MFCLLCKLLVFHAGTACLEYVHRREVSEAISLSHIKALKEEYNKKKLKHLQHTDIRYRQNYMNMSSLEYARIEFKFRTNMLDIRAKRVKNIQRKTASITQQGR